MMFEHLRIICVHVKVKSSKAVYLVLQLKPVAELATERNLRRHNPRHADR